MQKRKNDVKARTTLLLSLPDEHQLRFSKYKTAQELWAAILKTFGGNEATKKTKKNLLTQYGSQIKFEDINQIDEDDMEEMDIKWNMALLSMRADRFWKKIGKKISIQGIDLPEAKTEDEEIITDKGSKVEKQTPKALMEIDRVGWDWSFMVNEQEDHTLVADEEAPTEFTLMAKTSAECEDLSWIGIPEFADDTVTNYCRPLRAIERVKKRRSRPKNNCSNKSMTPRAVIHKPYRPPMRPVRPNMNVAQPKRISFHKLAHSYSKRPFQRTSAVRSQYRAPWVPTVNRNFPTINRKFPTINRKFPTGSTKFSTVDMGKRGNAVKASDSGYSRHMTGNISYLSDYEPFNGGYVSFGQGGCKITGKGIIKTGKLEFENVYFVNDLKYNLFSVSQICDNKNNVLFTDSECIVLGRNFKLTDDTNVLLRTPRQHNMYSIDLNNIVPHKDLT
nr:ribonuclease H-like domain-containing protein [Tanacetum cinerariifolium]